MYALNANWLHSTLLAALLAATFACDRQPTDAPDTQSTSTDREGLEAGVGVDRDTRTIHLGALNGETGPAGVTGGAVATGKRIPVDRANGDDALLPGDWTLELHEREHGYDPARAVRNYERLRSEVLFLATSFGAPTTLRLRSFLDEDDLLAFPASLSTKMAEHELTPPVGPTYRLEAMRAMDFAVEQAGDPDEVQAGILYHDDDYGRDGLDGWREAANTHGIEVVAEETVEPGADDVTSAVDALHKADANYVLLATLPSSTAPILQAADDRDYTPTWLGLTPSWVPAFFDPEGPLARDALQDFYRVTGLPYWGEDRPGMQTFLDAHETHADGEHARNVYVLASYIQGLLQLEILRRALEDGSLTRQNVIDQLHTITNWNADGLMPPLDFANAPYRPTTRVRVLEPMIDEKTWRVAGDYAEPKAVGAE